MLDDAKVLYRDKRVSRGMAALVMVPGLLPLLLAPIIALTNDTASKPLPSAALPFMVAALVALGISFFVLGIMFSVLRTLVTEREVHVKYGLWGPRIQHENIRSCEVVDYHWTEFGGFGLRYRNGVWAYVPAGVTKVIDLRYVENGKEKRILVGVNDAEETARQIRRAKESRRMRIVDQVGTEEGNEKAAAEDELAEMEAQAETEAAEAAGKKAARR